MTWVLMGVSVEAPPGCEIGMKGGDEEVLGLAMHDGFASGVVVAVVIMFVRWHWLGGLCMTVIA